MPGKIRLLTDEVIGKIAAGEVVERPAAAIKELVENCLDAGASAVTVEIRDGGISYFRVTDNGSGIQSGDIRMAFERHATSKITNAKDLTSIATLGFRGEALASIAAVSHVTCTTRTADEQIGLKVQNNGGTITSIEETACPVGTTFVVKDLFFNTPVRLKFLKKPATEAGYVSDLMMHMILSR
ncbi:MAG: DNA mismatch repair endonuclease MutL, partial [Clostridia bacterium]|nr:DNA mismatch repair endonuclease MutL [Clostridia bacterium]